MGQGSGSGMQPQGGFNWGQQGGMGHMGPNTSAGMFAKPQQPAWGAQSAQPQPELSTTQGPGVGMAPPAPPTQPPQQPELSQTQGPGTGMVPPVGAPAAPAPPQPWLPDNSINGGEWWQRNPAYAGADVPYPGTAPNASKGGLMGASPWGRPF